MIYLISGPDDAIVVVVMTTNEYLYDTEETNRIRELAAGFLREPPAPFFSHQSLVLKVARLLGDHAEPRRLGRVAVARWTLSGSRTCADRPTDVPLWHREAVDYSESGMGGARSGRGVRRSAPRTGTAKLNARHYGVRGWLVDLGREQLTVVDFTGASPVERVARGVGTVRSTVLPQLEVSGYGVFS
jgi:hypothetical protein